MARTRFPEYRHWIYRVDGDTAEPMEITIEITDIHYHYGLRGHDDWETVERVLVDQHKAGEWEPGRYRIEVTAYTFEGKEHPVATVERLLPLDPEYAKLPYSRNQFKELPARAYIHTLVSRYPGSTIELVAQRWVDFDAHYLATISTPELTARTGYEPPEDWVRPLSPYADEAAEDKQ